MKKLTASLFLATALVFPLFVLAADQQDESEQRQESFSLITETPEAGFQLAITLARKGVTETQPNREILFDRREVYSRDADSLIAASQVIAIHFQTIAAANNYWRDGE